MTAFTLSDILTAYGYPPAKLAFYMKPPARLRIRNVPVDIAYKIMDASGGTLLTYNHHTSVVEGESHATCDITNEYTMKEDAAADAMHAARAKIAPMLAAIARDPIAGAFMSKEQQLMLAKDIVERGDSERAKRYGVEL